eukprot:g4855.t1
MGGGTMQEMTKRGHGPVIFGVLELEKTPSFDAVACALEPLRLYPRFRSVMSSDGKWWEDVSDLLRIKDHIEVVPIQRERSQKDKSEDDFCHDAAETFVSNICSTPTWIVGRPQWRVYLLDYENTDRCDFIVQIHHALGDGITLIATLLDLCEEEVKGAGDRAEREEKSRRQRRLAIGRNRLDIFFSVFWQACITFCFSIYAGYYTESRNDAGLSLFLRFAAASAVFLLTLLVFTDLRIFFSRIIFTLAMPIASRDSPTILTSYGDKNRLSPHSRKRVMFSRIGGNSPSVENVKQIVRAQSTFLGLNLTFNDVMMTCLAGGIRDYLEKRKDPVLENFKENLQIFAMALVNLRASKGLQRSAKAMLENAKNARVGNSFTYFKVSLPCDENISPSKRLTLMHKTMKMMKNSPEAYIADVGNRLVFKLGGSSLLTSFAERIIYKHTTTVSNLAGPSYRLKIADAPIRRIYNVFAPLKFSQTFSLLTYNNHVTWGMSADENFFKSSEQRMLLDFVVNYFWKIAGDIPKVVK